jgi:RNA polymerase sigma-70 factor (ECF subfamily)
MIPESAEPGRQPGQDWIRRLQEPGEGQAEAIAALREYLLRAVLVYLKNHRSDLAAWSTADIRHFAEDVAQDSLLSVRNNLESFRGEAKFTTWAYRFAINRAASELRLSRYSDMSLDNLQDEDLGIFNPENFRQLLQDEEGVDPDLASERQDYIELLVKVIRQELTERQRLAIVAVHFQGRSMDEVAKQLGISRNATYKLLHDARRKIKAQFEERHLGAGDIMALFEG